MSVVSSVGQSRSETVQQGQGNGQNQDTAELLQQICATRTDGKKVKYLPKPLETLGRAPNFCSMWDEELVLFTFYSLTLY